MKKAERDSWKTRWEDEREFWKHCWEKEKIDKAACCIENAERVKELEDEVTRLRDVIQNTINAMEESPAKEFYEARRVTATSLELRAALASSHIRTGELGEETGA